MFLRFSISSFLLLLCSSFLFGANGGWTNGFQHPTSFTENVGQFKSPDGQKVFYAYDDGCNRIFFTSRGLVYSFVVKAEADKEPDYDYPEKEEENKIRSFTRDFVSFNWENSSVNCRLKDAEKATEYYSYVVEEGGQEKNINYISGFKKIIYENVYDGIDVEYTIHPQGGIKYALIIHPGADVNSIRMKYSKDVFIQNNEINIPTEFGNIIDHAPITFYQENTTSTINSSFKRYNNYTIGFNIGSYNSAKTIVIDPWTQNPVLNNTKKIWEVETDNAGNVYIYGGDMPVRILKYNAAGVLQWNYASAIDTANYWLGGMVTNQVTGESYITSGSIGKIWKVSTAGALVWTNTPPGSCEYWSLSFNCDGTKLAVGGSSGIFSIRGYMFNINLGTGAQAGTRLVGYGSMGFPPTMQEASSITWGPYSNYYFLTLDTIGSVSDAMTTMGFKTSTGYLFDYYIPNFGVGTKQPISATRANTVALYTVNGTTVHKRNLLTGAVMATAAIPGGTSATGFFGGRKLPNNMGIDIDNCGNVYVGSVNQLLKYDGNLVLLSSVANTFPIYDVDVSIGGDVAVCGFAGGTGYVKTIAMAACAQVTPVCLAVLPVSLSSFEASCENNKAKIEWTTETEANNSFFTILRSADGINFEEIKKVSGSGNSNSKKKYSFFDQNPLDGISYYKLNQTDLSGNVNPHDMVIFDNNCNSLPYQLNIYPNPFNTSFNIDINLQTASTVEFELFNTMGEKIKDISLQDQLYKGSHTFNTLVTDLKPSIYFIKATVNGQSSVFKIVKQD